MHEAIYYRLGLGILLPALLFSLLISPGARSAEVTLAWDPPEDDRVVGYQIYYGEAGTDFTIAPQITIYDSDTTRSRISDLEEGVVYAFAATSFDAFERESNFSEILLYRISEREIDEDESFEEESESGGGGGGCFLSTLYRDGRLRSHLKTSSNTSRR